MSVGSLAAILLLAMGEPHPWLPPYGIDRVGHEKAEFQADARIAVSPRINPVDLGCILPPHDGVLLGPGQSATGEMAVFSKVRDYPAAQLRARFRSEPAGEVSSGFPIAKGERVQRPFAAPPIPKSIERDLLEVELRDGAESDAAVLWTKSIPVMTVRSPPKLPSFGATRLKLRYDSPISVREADGSFSEMSYQTAWPPALDDVVVTLPGGGRFVFWRGSSYVPFWAGDHNTGLSYEWAETTPPKDGFADCVEPLMDKELRYGRVEVLESTAARVRVRWTYQSCDFLYKVWGDTAEEVFTFYPDGYGTRTLTIQSALDGNYELSEFIILTPQGAYPFEVLPKQVVSLLFGDGSRYDMDLPVQEQLPQRFPQLSSGQLPAVYRVKLHRDDPRTAIYFHSQDVALPPVAFGGFQDAGQTVTPCYWGSHWPLARGQTTGGAINDRIHASPCHNSLLSWAMQRPAPLRESALTTIDSLGRSRPMRRQTWTWLIGLTDAADDRVREMARSFASPPGLGEIRGARLDAETSVPERRAVRVVADGDFEFLLTPQPVCVHPVLEIEGQENPVSRVLVDGQELEREAWAGEAGVLWIGREFREPSRVRVEFDKL